VSDLAKPHDSAAMLGALRDGRRRAPPLPGSEGAAEREARREAEMAAIRAVAIPPPASDAELKHAARLLVQRIVAIGKDFLTKNPYRDPPSEREDDFRELAAAVSDEGWHGLVPLFDALAKAMESPSADGAKYRYGFLLRLIEGTLDVAKIAGSDAITVLLEPRSRGGTDGGGRAAKEKKEKWHALGLPLARAIRETNPEISQETLATDIKFKLDDLVPGVRAIERAIRAWEKNGDLVRRVRNSR
jgi:hypothetical protein